MLLLSTLRNCEFMLCRYATVFARFRDSESDSECESESDGESDNESQSQSERESESGSERHSDSESESHRRSGSVIGSGKRHPERGT